MIKFSALVVPFVLNTFSLLSIGLNIEDLTTEEKVGQLLIVHFNGERVNQEAKTLVEEVGVGGVIYYEWSNGLRSPQQVRELSQQLQDLAKETKNQIPLLISVDQEGGLVTRLKKGFTIFPGNMALGATENPNLAEKAAEAIGKELKSVGVNMNLSPVVDINSHPQNSVIGIRSFGDTAETVKLFAKSTVQGYQKSQTITCLKHFPGHGHVSVDSHEDLPVLKKSVDELREFEWIPYYELADKADTIMTAHILIPSIDPLNCATLSKKCLDYLRTEIRFDGVIVSDSLVMEGLLKNGHSIKDIAIRAVNAGCDMLILGGKQLSGTHQHLELTVSDVQGIHQALVEAVKSGLISMDRLDFAVNKILDLKKRYFSQSKIHRFSSEEHKKISDQIASKALKIDYQLDSCFSDFSNYSKIAIIAPDIVKGSIMETQMTRINPFCQSHFFQGLNPSSLEIKKVLDSSKEADHLIFCSYNAWKSNGQKQLIDSLIASDKPFFLIVLRDSLDEELYASKASVILKTSSPTAPSIEAACLYLKEQMLD